MSTVSVGASGVASPVRPSTGSPFTNTFTYRRNAPVSSRSRHRTRGYRVSRSSSIPRTVDASVVTARRGMNSFSIASSRTATIGGTERPAGSIKGAREGLGDGARDGRRGREHPGLHRDETVGRLRVEIVPVREGPPVAPGAVERFAPDDELLRVREVGHLVVRAGPVEESGPVLPERLAERPQFVRAPGEQDVEAGIGAAARGPFLPPDPDEVGDRPGERLDRVRV